jgi:pimeloyl-ACP methyl ester carboxylesterase
MAVGCSDRSRPPTEGSPSIGKALNASATELWQTTIDGETGPGSSYRLYMPKVWNGRLVVYAHGIVPPFLPADLNDEGDGMAAIFGSQGFAVARSSYSETGLAIKDGVQRTHQLRGLFASRFNQPSRTYLVGRSMGGFIVTALAEKFPGQYDGVMPICGVVGGFTGEFSYVFNARTLFDMMYPGVLPGSVTAVPMPSDPAGGLAAAGAIQNAAVGAILSDIASPLPKSVQIALLDQTSMPLPGTMPGPVSGEQFVAFAATPLVLHAIFVNDIVQHTHGHIPFENASTTYSSSFLPPALVQSINAGIPRITGDRDALNWIAHNGETSGDLTIPMLSLHTRYDTWVPIVTEAIYRDKVHAKGHDNMLVQRTTEGFDHCNFQPAEIAQGLHDLVAWVEGPQP